MPNHDSTRELLCDEAIKCEKKRDNPMTARDESLPKLQRCADVRTAALHEETNARQNCNSAQTFSRQHTLQRGGSACQNCNSAQTSRTAAPREEANARQNCNSAQTLGRPLSTRERMLAKIATVRRRSLDRIRCREKRLPELQQCADGEQRWNSAEAMEYGKIRSSRSGYLFSLFLYHNYALYFTVRS